MELPPYNARTHEGFLKHLTIRSGRWGVCKMLKLILGDWLVFCLVSFWLITYPEIFFEDDACKLQYCLVGLTGVTGIVTQESYSWWLILLPKEISMSSFNLWWTKSRPCSHKWWVRVYILSLIWFLNRRESCSSIHEKKKWYTHTNTHTQLWFVFLVSLTEFPNHIQWILHRWVWLIMWTQQWAHHQLWIRSMYYMAKHL